LEVVGSYLREPTVAAVTLVRAVAAVGCVCAGNSSEAQTFQVNVKVGAATFDGFITMVRGMRLRTQLEHTLIVKITNAQRSYAIGQATAARGQLTALLNEVDAQARAQKISSEQATALRNAINAILNAA